MSFITRYGGFWGMLPQTSGRIFWVAPAASYTVEGRTYIASDNHDGLSPERAFRTVDYAVGQCAANVGDVIVLLPGSHSTTATINVDVAGITITGIPRGAASSNPDRGAGGGVQNQTSITTTGSNHIFTVTVADIELAYLHVIPAAGFAGVGVTDGAGDRLFVHDCTWNMTTAANTATIGITVTAAADLLTVRNNFVFVQGNQGPWIRASAATLYPVIENNTVLLSGDTAWDDAIEFTSTALGLMIRDNDFFQAVSGTVMTDVLDVAGATTDGAVSIYRNFFPVGSDPIEPGAAADLQLIENYIAQTGGATGGTDVTT